MACLHLQYSNWNSDGTETNLSSDVKYLNLTGNGITNLCAIQIACSSLVYINLSRNNLTNLYDEKFWSRFVGLKALLLAENELASWKSAAPVCGCPNLLYLTLFGNLFCSQDLRSYFVNKVQLVCNIM